MTPQDFKDLRDKVLLAIANGDANNAADYAGQLAHLTHVRLEIQMLEELLSGHLTRRPLKKRPHVVRRPKDHAVPTTTPSDTVYPRISDSIVPIVSQYTALQLVNYISHIEPFLTAPCRLCGKPINDHIEIAISVGGVRCCTSCGVVARRKLHEARLIHFQKMRRQRQRFLRRIGWVTR